MGDKIITKFERYKAPRLAAKSRKEGHLCREYVSRVAALYYQGLNDAAIAEITDVPKDMITCWRMSTGKRENIEFKGEWENIDHDRKSSEVTTYRMTDEELAEWKKYLPIKGYERKPFILPNEYV